MEFLFVYGTLQDPQVQSRVFGRTTEGRPDTLGAYRKAEIVIEGSAYPIAVSESSSTISGRVLEVTPKELADIDRYEGSQYRRLRVTLLSGVETWVYCR